MLKSYQFCIHYTFCKKARYPTSFQPQKSVCTLFCAIFLIQGAHLSQNCENHAKQQILYHSDVAALEQSGQQQVCTICHRDIALPALVYHLRASYTHKTKVQNNILRPYKCVQEELVYQILSQHYLVTCFILGHTLVYARNNPQRCFFQVYEPTQS